MTSKSKELYRMYPVGTKLRIKSGFHGSGRDIQGRWIVIPFEEGLEYFSESVLRDMIVVRDDEGAFYEGRVNGFTQKHIEGMVGLTCAECEGLAPEDDYLCLECRRKNA